MSRRGAVTEAILVVEDDPEARDLAAEHLEAEGWGVRTAGSVAEAEGVLAEASVGLVVLDLGLPDVSGLELLGTIRRRDPDLPVIILTAERGEPARVRGLWRGADDYLEKPFSPRELAARIRSILRRSEVTVADRVVGGGVVVDHPCRTVTVDDQELELTRLEFDVLAYLVAHAGQVISHDQLRHGVWEADGLAGSRTTVTEIVGRVRRKLDAAAPGRRHIETRRGVGYRFDPGD